MKLSFLRDIKAQQMSLRDHSKTYARSKYYDEAKPWNERCDIAFTCASQNEIDQSDAINLVNSGCFMLVEGSSMPCTPEAVDVLRKANVLIAPAMAAGVGGVRFLAFIFICPIIHVETHVNQNNGSNDDDNGRRGVKLPTL